MTANPFSTPSSSEKVVVAENMGKLFLITPKEVLASVPTVHGDKEALVADVTILDTTGKGAHTVHNDVRIFQGVLIGKLKTSIGKPMPVLGTLGQGEAKKGKNAPWVINAPTEAEIKLALDYWNDLQKKNPFGEAA
jgi:hypothetical protein